MEETVEAVEHKRRRSRAQRGSIIKRGENWTIVYRTPEGKQKWEGGFLKKDRAQARLDEVLGAIRSNKYIERTDQTFKEFCDASMEKLKYTLAPKTWGQYESALKRWILPKFGDWPICNITRPAVKDFIDTLRLHQTLGPSGIDNIRRILHCFLEKALDDELIVVNPAHKIKAPKNNKAEVVPPTDKEIKKVSAQLPIVFQYLVIAGVFTGARRGELLALQWEDIDLAKGVISIKRNFSRVTKRLLNFGTFRNIERLGDTGLVFSTLKTKRSQRLIEIGPQLWTLLQRMHQERNGCEFVFHDDLGKPIDPGYATKIIRSARKEVGVEEFHLHLLRHLHGSLCLQAGANVKQAQARLGHANASTTLNIYAHVVSDEGHKLSKKVEAALPCVSLLLANEKPTALLPASVKQ